MTRKLLIILFLSSFLATGCYTQVANDTPDDIYAQSGSVPIYGIGDKIDTSEEGDGYEGTYLGSDTTYYSDEEGDVVVIDNYYEKIKYIEALGYDFPESKKVFWGYTPATEVYINYNYVSPSWGWSWGGSWAGYWGGWCYPAYYYPPYCTPYYNHHYYSGYVYYDYYPASYVYTPSPYRYRKDYSGKMRDERGGRGYVSRDGSSRGRVAGSRDFSQPRSAHDGLRVARISDSREVRNRSGQSRGSVPVELRSAVDRNKGRSSGTTQSVGLNQNPRNNGDIDYSKLRAVKNNPRYDGRTKKEVNKRDINAVRDRINNNESRNVSNKSSNRSYTQNKPKNKYKSTNRTQRSNNSSNNSVGSSRSYESKAGKTYSKRSDNSSSSKRNSSGYSSSSSRKSSPSYSQPKSSSSNKSYSAPKRSSGNSSRSYSPPSRSSGSRGSANKSSGSKGSSRSGGGSRKR